VTSRPIHVDFVRIGEHAQVHVDVPVRFVDEEQAPGLKRGGVLNVVRHELELVCDAAKIPNEIVISLAGLEIGDAVHISHVSLPEGSKSAIEDRDFTVATVVAPSAMKAEAEEEEAAPAADEVPAIEQEGEGLEEDQDRGTPESKSEE
jgi:large subunit ribosomal protein L25